MSASSTHLAEVLFDSTLKLCPIASAHLLSFRNQYELLSAVVSDTGSRAIRYKACMALSFMVGIPNGRSFPLLFLMFTLFKGWGWYPLLFCLAIAMNLTLGVDQIFLSTPAVLLPLFEDTRFTAKALA